MPQITIDGKTIEAAEGQTIIEAAYSNGMEIPHFCWHPGLTAPANCRICLVDVGMPQRNRDGELEVGDDGQPVVKFFPKLQVACRTPVADGMQVRLTDDKTVAAQEAVMEFLLINHPLDCPICDEAGQCKLQEYAFRHSTGESRFIEEKVQKDKRVPWGPNVLFDGERCISCSRCIRFGEEVAEQPVLSFVKRGDKVTIETFEGKEFDNPYSMNVIDICPVGALTSPDFRFRARVWDMSFNHSICPGCSRGCNIQIGVRNNEAMRLEPATNMRVNEYWMCDAGRLSQYKHINEQRISQSFVRRGETTVDVDWAEAVARAAERIRAINPTEILVLGSGYATCEDNYALARFAAETLKTKNIDVLEHNDPHFGDKLLRRNDRTPNRAGAIAVGVQPETGGVGKDNWIEKINEGVIKAVWVMEDDPASLSAEAAAALEKAELVIAHASNHNATTALADIVFAAPTYAEVEGVFVNCDGRAQHLSPAIVTAENERRMGMKMSRLDKFGAANDRWTHGDRRNCRQSWKPLQMVAAALGGDTWGYSRSENVFDEICERVEDFQGMSYAILRENGGAPLGKVDESEAIMMQYDSHVLKPN